MPVLHEEKPYFDSIYRLLIKNVQIGLKFLLSKHPPISIQNDLLFY
jgi:hypothetical protein